MERQPFQPRNDRHYRQFDVELRLQAEGKEMYAEGYAATFNQPTVLYEIEGRQYREVIKPGAFDGADMSDVVFNFNHSGRVYARTRNKTLQLTPDSKGLHIRARLDLTQGGRELYEDIDAGMIDKMSFAFRTADNGAPFDRDTLTRTINKFKRIFDVAAVDFPAYDTTSIHARSAFSAEIEAEEAGSLELYRRRLILLSQT